MGPSALDELPLLATITAGDTFAVNGTTDRYVHTYPRTYVHPLAPAHTKAEQDTTPHSTSTPPASYAAAHLLNTYVQVCMYGYASPITPPHSSQRPHNAYQVTMATCCGVCL